MAITEAIVVALIGLTGSGIGSLIDIIYDDTYADPASEYDLIIDFSLLDAWRAGFRDVVFVIKHEIEEDFKKINDELETVFLTTNVQYSFISSTIVKDILRHNGDVSHFVPQSVLEMIYNLGGSNYGSSNGN